jgi:hypothetical protein
LLVVAVLPSLRVPSPPIWPFDREAVEQTQRQIEVLYGGCVEFKFPELPPPVEPPPPSAPGDSCTMLFAGSDGEANTLDLDLRGPGRADRLAGGLGRYV